MRRNLLLSYLATQFKWLPYSYEYIYHNLVPSEMPRFNIWDEHTELGSYSFETGNPVSSSVNLRSDTDEPIRVIPNTDYYIKTPNQVHVMQYNKDLNFLGYVSIINQTFKTPANCVFIKFVIASGYGTTYNHDICINKSNAQLNGHYAPYSPRKVLDKSRILKISGNSEVSNQLFNADVNVLWGGAVTKVDSFTLKFNSSFTNSSGSTYFIYLNTPIRVASSHKVLVSVETNLTSDSNFRFADSGIFTYGANLPEFNKSKIVVASQEIDSYISLRVPDGYTIPSGSYFKVNVSDLTQDYPFNTPTSITDPRVQNIIAQGYLPKNDGEIKNSVISEVESRGFNIWDEEWESGYFDPTTGQPTANNSIIRTKNNISVLPNTTYYCKSSHDTWCFFYDENGNLITGVGTGSYPNIINIANTTFTTPNNCKTIKFYCIVGAYQNDICINRSSSLNGIYKPHIPNDKIQLPAPLELGGVNTAENTFEVTDEAYVFTRNVFEVSLKDLSYTLSSVTPNAFYSSGISNYKGSASVEGLGSKYEYIGTTNDGTKGLASYGNVCALYYNSSSPSTREFYVKDTSCADVTALMTKLQQNNATFTYQLATPQVISIPRKHLGWVKLKDLSWELYATNVFVAKISSASDNNLCFTHKYLYSPATTTQETANKSLRISKDGTKYVIVKDTSYSTTTDLINSFTDTDILFYETQNETTDFVNEEVVESGGEVNGNLFSWNKNQLVANSVIKTYSNYTPTRYDGTKGFSNIVDNAYSDLVVGHKVLVIAKISNLPANLDNVSFLIGTEDVKLDSSTPAKAQIVEVPNNTYKFIRVYTTTLDQFSITIDNYEIIDLTIGFGAGKEPTSIDDYRIQKIIELGYIPQDLVGTHTQVNCEVLPNVEMLLKCK